MRDVFSSRSICCESKLLSHSCASFSVSLDEPHCAVALPETISVALVHLGRNPSGVAPHLVQVVVVLSVEGSAEGLTVRHGHRDQLAKAGRTRAQAVVTLTMGRTEKQEEEEEMEEGQF